MILAEKFFFVQYLAGKIPDLRRRKKETLYRTILNQNKTAEGILTLLRPGTNPVLKCSPAGFCRKIIWFPGIPRLFPFQNQSVPETFCGYSCFKTNLFLKRSAVIPVSKLICS
jgi:hypothetical protein